ncbi:MAG: SPOR domain-containing protein [Rhodothermales bacterium]
MYGKLGVIVLLMMFVSACAGPREVAEPVEESVVLPSPEVRLSAYEDFDASRYEEPELGPMPPIEHDVPARLMEGRADEGIRRELQGLRVQIHSSLEKSEAVEVEEELQEWLRSENENEAVPSALRDLPIYVVYIQPYYRVRVGNFTSREAADRVRRYVARQFPNAFIVPDTVVITR